MLPSLFSNFFSDSWTRGILRTVRAQMCTGRILASKRGCISSHGRTDSTTYVVLFNTSMVLISRLNIPRIVAEPWSLLGPLQS
ncbi:hypothetical protein M413DRAFT_145789 [Hebeloma cylindrosporum]|uniref:Uncharacterized protein n=1 Tax=Hebeloma cylindrosporum TaxID=76867 RepID=A0A0C3CCE8_HEBCY|nr:hypothetical protein M413DRAFT_145789 [Hebeloma cylindrosporum h7]